MAGSSAERSISVVLRAGRALMPRAVSLRMSCRLLIGCPPAVPGNSQG